MQKVIQYFILGGFIFLLNMVYIKCIYFSLGHNSFLYVVGLILLLKRCTVNGHRFSPL